MRKIGKMVSGAAVLLMLAAACGGKKGRGADFSEGKNRDIEVIDIDKAKREKALLYSSILEEPDVIVGNQSGMYYSGRFCHRYI